MAKIKRKQFSGKQGQLFPLSPVAISEKLYNLIAGAVEEKIGKEVEKITQNKIKKILSVPEFEEVFFVNKRHCLELPIVVLDILFPASYDYGEVVVSLRLPLYGDCGRMEEATKKDNLRSGLGRSFLFPRGHSDENYLVRRKFALPDNSQSVPFF